jgi:hypothetical protein
MSFELSKVVAISFNLGLVITFVGFFTTVYVSNAVIISSISGFTIS